MSLPGARISERERVTEGSVRTCEHIGDPDEDGLDRIDLLKLAQQVDE